MATGLQAELKQTKPFPRRTNEALLSILRTAAVLDHQLNDVLRPFGLTTTQHNVLRILRGAGEGGRCGREVAERLVSNVPDVPRLLDRMEVIGLVSRERDSDDRRQVTARITRKGLGLLTRVTPVIDAVERARLGQLSEKTLDSLIEALATIRESA